MLALLQAMSNRYRMKLEDSKEDVKSPDTTHLHYTNLQNIKASDEGARSREIMRIQQEFPLSFSAISLTHDSEFYMDGIHGIDPNKVRQQIIKQQTPSPKHTPTILDTNYKEAFKTEILNDHNFSLDTIKQGTGYYFPIQNNDEKDLFKEAVESIIDKAYTLADKMEPSVADIALDDELQKIFEWEKKAAFRELVILGVARYFQTKNMAELPKGSTSLAITACKENIDRGGKMTAEFAYSAIEGQEEASDCAYNAAISRAPLARFRIPLDYRMKPFMALLEVKHSEISEFLKKIVPEITDPNISFGNGKVVN